MSGADQVVPHVHSRDCGCTAIVVSERAQLTLLDVILAGAIDPFAQHEDAHGHEHLGFLEDGKLKCFALPKSQVFPIPFRLAARSSSFGSCADFSTLGMRSQ